MYCRPWLDSLVGWSLILKHKSTHSSLRTIITCPSLACFWRALSLEGAPTTHIPRHENRSRGLHEGERRMKPDNLRTQANDETWHAGGHLLVIPEQEEVHGYKIHPVKSPKQPSVGLLAAHHRKALWRSAGGGVAPGKAPSPRPSAVSQTSAEITGFCCSSCAIFSKAACHLKLLAMQNLLLFPQSSFLKMNVKSC